MKDQVSWLLAGVKPEAGGDDNVAVMKFVGMIVGATVGGLLCFIVPITVVAICCCRFHYLRRFTFYARQHICYSAYMLWQFRLSVCLSVRHTGESVKNG